MVIKKTNWCLKLRIKWTFQSIESHNSRRRAKQTGNAKEKTTQSWRKDPKACQYMKSLKIPKGNQNPHIEEELTTQ